MDMFSMRQAYYNESKDEPELGKDEPTLPLLPATVGII